MTSAPCPEKRVNSTTSWVVSV